MIGVGWEPFQVSPPITDERLLARYGEESRIVCEYTEHVGMNLKTGLAAYRKKRERWNAEERRLYVDIWRTVDLTSFC